MLNITTLYFAPNGALMCSLQFSHHTVIFNLCNFHRLDFLMEVHSVLCEEHSKTFLPVVEEVATDFKDV